MALYPNYHTYCSVSFLRDILAGSSDTAGWTQDAVVLRESLERASKTVDAYIGGQTFGATTETRLYDLGGSQFNDQSLRFDPRYELPNSQTLNTYEFRNAIIPLDRWLLSPTTVTAYGDTARSTSETLTEGIDNDFLLEPYNQPGPKWRLKLTEETTKAFSSGQQVLSIAGTWGWSNEKTTGGTITGAISSTTAHELTVSAVSHSQGGVHGPGTTIQIDDEQMYCTAISSTTLTVIRGVNGTTAATHSSSAAVSIYTYPSDVQMVTADIARIQYRDRDMGIVETIGTGDQTIQTRPSAEIRGALLALDHYYVSRDSAGLVF